MTTPFSILATEQQYQEVSKSVIRIATGEWPPYTSKKLKHYGVFSHIVTKSFAKENIHVVYNFFPWKRAFEQVLTGKWDASPTWVPTPERLQDFHYSDVVYINQKVFFYIKKNKFSWRSINDLKEYIIGSTLGYTYGEEFDTAAENGDIQVVPVRSDSLNFKMLLKGRIDIFPIEKDVGLAIIKDKLGIEAQTIFTYHPKAVMETTHHVIFTKQGDRGYIFKEKFNRGLNKLIASGELKAMIESSLRGEYETE